MSSCIKCGSGQAYWTIRDKENNVEYYCDPCFKKNNMAEYKQEMDEYHERKKQEMDEHQERKKKESIPQVKKAGLDKPYQFKNKRFYSGRPISDLLGVILLTNIGEEILVAGSKTFVGSIQDAVGNWLHRIKEQGPIFAIGEMKTPLLFRDASLGFSFAKQNIIDEGIKACQWKSSGKFPPEPVKNHYYHVGAMPTNERTGKPFITIAVYK